LVSRLWELPVDPRPVEDLLALANLVAGHYLDATGTPEPLDAPALSNLWTRLEAKYPEEFRGPLDGRTAPPVPVVR
jgi:hypothetical protein